MMLENQIGCMLLPNPGGLMFIGDAQTLLFFIFVVSLVGYGLCIAMTKNRTHQEMKGTRIMYAMASFFYTCMIFLTLWILLSFFRFTVWSGMIWF